MEKFKWNKNYGFLIGLFVAGAYFCYFVLPSLRGWFNDDDPMNIHIFWSPGPWILLRDLILFFTPHYRPMGGVYFYTLYQIFGLNAFPYHVVIVILLLTNVVLVYRCTVLLSGSRIVAGLCAVLMAYHVNMLQLAYLPAFVYDVLCFTFYFSALFYYLRLRFAGKELNWRQALIFILLYIGAIQSKEMGVSLPIMILAFELLWHPPDWNIRGIQHRLQTSWIPMMLSVFLTLCFIVGKSVGPEALSNNPQYHPTVTFAKFFESNVRFFGDIFYVRRSSVGVLLLVWCLMAYIAWRRREKHLYWALLLTIVAPLPIAFIPGRGGAMLYIPFFGWALTIATLAAAICGVVAREPLVRFLPRNIAGGVILLSVVGLLWYKTDIENRKMLPNYRKYSGRQFRSVRDQLAVLLPQLKPGTKIAFYNDIFEGWDSAFIAELFYHDRSIQAKLNARAPLSQDQLSESHYVLAYDHEKLVILKKPNEPFIPPLQFSNRPGVRIEANGKEFRAGKDTLVLRFINFDSRNIDILYSLDGRLMPPLSGWILDENHQASFFLNESVTRGVYSFRGIRESSSGSSDIWIAAKLDITVK